VLGTLSLLQIPIDIPAGLQSACGAGADVLQRDAGQQHREGHHQPHGAVDGPGGRTSRQESRSIVGRQHRPQLLPGRRRSQRGAHPGELAGFGRHSEPAPGTLPPVVLPFDPTTVVPACLVALDSRTQDETILYDVGRYEVRNMIMSSPGAVAPVVYGGKLRAVLAYINRSKMQAGACRRWTLMRAWMSTTCFWPTGDAKFGTTDYAIDSHSMFSLIDRMGDIPLRTQHGNAAYLRDVATPMDASLIQTNVVRVNGRRQVYIPVYRNWAPARSRS